jgi:putative PIN family toxin of toxin-antitoxin system
MRAVVDTNVFLASLINQSGAPAKIRHRWLEGQFILVTSPAIEAEYKDVLSHSSQLQPEEVQELLSEIWARSLLVPIGGTLHVCKDPDDDVFLETALVGEAEFLVTKNLKHFPRKFYHETKIVKVSAFLRELEKIFP